MSTPFFKPFANGKEVLDFIYASFPEEQHGFAMWLANSVWAMTKADPEAIHRMDDES